MKVLSRLKHPARITSYVQPKKIVMLKSQADLARRLGIPIKDYALAHFKTFYAYKRRYC